MDQPPLGRALLKGTRGYSRVGTPGYSAVLAEYSRGMGLPMTTHGNFSLFLGSPTIKPPVWTICTVPWLRPKIDCAAMDALSESEPGRSSREYIWSIP
jgi:hypothetical protein